MEHDAVRDVVIVGGGAAGLSDALTLARASRRVTVVNAGEPRNGPAESPHAGFFAGDQVLDPDDRARLQALDIQVIAGPISRLGVWVAGNAFDLSAQDRHGADR